MAAPLILGWEYAIALRCLKLSVCCGGTGWFYLLSTFQAIGAIQSQPWHDCPFLLLWHRGQSQGCLAVEDGVSLLFGSLCSPLWPLRDKSDKVHRENVCCSWRYLLPSEPLETRRWMAVCRKSAHSTVKGPHCSALNTEHVAAFLSA